VGNGAWRKRGSLMPSACVSELWMGARFFATLVHASLLGVYGCLCRRCASVLLSRFAMPVVNLSGSPVAPRFRMRAALDRSPAAIRLRGAEPVAMVGRGRVGPCENSSEGW